MRNIVVNGKSYKWKVGRKNVLIKHESLKMVVPFITIIAHRFQTIKEAQEYAKEGIKIIKYGDNYSFMDYIESGIRNRNFHITPKDIQIYLSRV